VGEDVLVRGYARNVASPSHPIEAAELVAAVPPDEYALFELATAWDDLAGVEAQLAAALRLFVITRDPLAWLPDRGTAWATATGDGDALELPVYVALDEVRRRLTATGGDIAKAVGPFAESAVLGAIRSQGIVIAGAYPDLACRGEAEPLLAAATDGGGLGLPAVTVRHAGWEPIGLGAIQDLVQDAFGSVDFDRSMVALGPSDAPRAGCPACTGIRFGFPGELAEARATMCKRHRTDAEEITASRIGRARASNPAGWGAIAKASARINGLPEPVAMPAPERRHSRPNRNDPCSCGSGRKYKHCCGK
jgi:SEC-C motif